MNNLSTLRRNRALTLIELARLTGLPARRIAEAEYGLRSLSAYECEQLAVVFELPVEVLQAQLVTPAHPPLSPHPGVFAHFTLLLLLGAMLVLLVLLAISTGSLPLLSAWHTPALAQEAEQVALASISPTVVPSPTLTAPPPVTVTAMATPVPTVTATSVPTPTPTPLVLNEPLPPAGDTEQTAAPTATPPLFLLTEAGPLGCPLQPSHGHVVMTQGYGVGSHAPADVWGAVDLAVIDRSQGYKDITTYVPVVATHDGVAYVSLESWPGGNHVTVVDPVTGWRTGYAHLAYVFLESGTAVTAGNYIGLAGSSGQATGPHLDYQVWYGDTNIDPTNLVRVCP